MHADSTMNTEKDRVFKAAAAALGFSDDHDKRYEELRAISGWYITEAEELELAELSSKRSAVLRSIPEYAKHERDGVALCGILTDLLRPEDAMFDINTAPAELNASVIHQLTPQVQKSMRLPAYDESGYETETYQKYKKQTAWLNTALRHYSLMFRLSLWDEASRDRKNHETVIGPLHMETLRSAFKAASAAFDVGASLYIYQKMHNEKISKTPSLSKAAWLVKNAPLKNIASETHIPRGKWQIIQEQWKNHYRNSHYWAALIAMSKNPFEYTEATILNFICNANYDDFMMLSSIFKEFRCRVIVPPGGPPGKIAYIKRGINCRKTHDDDDSMAPISILTPNLIQDFQWDALSRYTSKAR